jgi:hypothetical protein
VHDLQRLLRGPPDRILRLQRPSRMGAEGSRSNDELGCYHRSRTHLSLGKDAPEPRAVQPPTMGEIVELPEVGGLHHRYERRAA